MISTYLQSCSIVFEQPIEHIFVTGSGFTRAFVPDAPLLVDDFGNDALVEKVRGLPAASRLLEDERRLDHRGYINIERLMSRLDTLMPYDYEDQANNEYVYLLSELKSSFLQRIEEAMANADVEDKVKAFARLCVDLRATCITFNYDCYLDEALYYTGRWSPDWGYGFFCRPSSVTVSQGTFEDAHASESKLLKLHGSINWRPRLGYTGSVALDAIVHHDKMSLFHDVNDPNVVARHLEIEPVIVPPVLAKSALGIQPALRLVWDLAFKRLSTADSMTFIGYSLPITDASARTLFAEALSDLPPHLVRVVDFTSDERHRSKLKTRYRDVLGEIPDDHFFFDGAVDWIKTHLVD